MVVSRRECGVEEARLCAGEVKVGFADGPEPESRAYRCPRSRAHLTHPVGHALSELFDRGVANGRQERVAVGEMAVGGVRDDTDHARHLAEHDRVRTPRSRELEASLDERGPDSAAGTWSAAQSPISRVRPTSAVVIACRHCSTF